MAQGGRRQEAKGTPYKLKVKFEIRKRLSISETKQWKYVK